MSRDLAKAERERLLEASQWWMRLQESAEADQTVEWLEWVQQDPRNLEAFNRIESTSFDLRHLDAAQRAELLEQFSRTDSSEQVRSSNVRTSESRRFQWLFAPTLRYAALACSLCLAVAVAFIALKPAEVPTQARGTTTYHTGHALHQDVTLADGSHVSIGASSTVVVQMKDDMRLVQLNEGEAFFKVHHEPERPFVVDAGQLTVTAVGTAFNVRRIADNIAVSVTEGRTRIASPDGGAIEVGAGEQVVYDAQTRTFNHASVESRIATAWRERRLEFVNEPLEVVAANVNRYVDVSIHMADEEAGNLTFTGTVMPQNIDAWLRALPNVLPVEIDEHDKKVLISKK